MDSNVNGRFSEIRQSRLDRLVAARVAEGRLPVGESMKAVADAMAAGKRTQAEIDLVVAAFREAINFRRGERVKVADRCPEHWAIGGIGEVIGHVMVGAIRRVEIRFQGGKVGRFEPEHLARLGEAR